MELGEVPSTSRIRMTNEWDASVITPDTAPHAAAALTPNNHCDKCGRDMHSHCFLNVRKAGHCTHCIRCRAVRSTIRKATEQQPPGMDNAFVRADIEDLMRDYLSSWKSRVNRLQSQDLFHSDFDPETMVDKWAKELTIEVMAKHKPCGRLSKSSKGRARELDADDDDASYEPSVREDTPEPKQLATPKSNRRDLSSKTKEPTPPAVAVAASAADEQNGVNTSGSFTPHQAPRPQPSQQLPVRGYTVEELDMTANELYVVEDSQNSPLEFAGYPAHLAPVEVEETSRPKTPTPATTEGSILDETSDSTEAEPAFEDIDMMPCSPIVQQPAEKRPEARLGAFTSKQTLTEAQNAYIQQAPRTLLDPASAVKPLPQARDLVDTTNDTTISDVARQFNLNEAKTGVRNFLEALERIERLPSPLRSFILGRYDMDFSQLTLADIPEIARSLHRSAARQEEEIKEGELRQQRSPRKMLAVA